MQSDPVESANTPTPPARAAWPEDDRKAWVELAYTAGIETLKAQREELSGMRQRAITYTSFVIAASGFLVGTGLNRSTGSEQFLPLAIAGTALFGVLAVALILLVAPILRYKFSLDSETLLRWMDGDHTAPSRQIALRTLAQKKLPEMRKHNLSRLKVARFAFGLVLTSGAAALGCWIWAVWAMA